MLFYVITGQKKAKSCSILQHIEETASSRYQIQPINGAFEYLLLNGRALVIFDGLDELLDTSYRQEISNDIESFCSLYPSVPVLVTSRSVGYEQAPLDEKRFEAFNITEFNDKQIEEYTTKWFALESEYTVEQKKQKVMSFLDESAIVRDLRSNPLMLALMCNIYRGENYIPKNRPEVYEKCATMLFERWDTSRGIRVPLPFEAHIRPAMMYLAYWIYGNDTLQGGVTEHQLVEEASKYLLTRRFEDPDEAKSAAKQFIEFCKGRAWVFTDTGTTKDGERLYQFTHRTFLEYFTAYHLFRVHSTPRDLGKILIPRIIKREWDSVAQLSLQILNKNVEGAGDEILKSVLNEAETFKQGSDSKWNLLSFASRCLEFIVPSPKILRNITEDCFRENIYLCTSYYVEKKEKRTIHRTFTESLISSLLVAAKENINLVLDEIINKTIELTKGEDKIKSIVAIENGMFLELYGNRTNEDRIEKAVDTIIEACLDNLNELKKEVYYFSSWLFLKGKNTIHEIYQSHSFKNIFSETPNMSIDFSLPSIADILLGDILNNHIRNSYRKYDLEKALIEIGEASLISKLPLGKFKVDRFRIFGQEAIIAAQKKGIKSISAKIENLKKDHKIFFGFFVLFASSLEEMEINDKENINELLKNIEKDFILEFKPAILSRYSKLDNLKILQDSFSNYSYSENEKKFILKWSQRQISFFG